MSVDNKAIIVCGPTATGKTELAVQICRQFNGVLLNIDSQQVYKNLDIGTNKGQIIKKDFVVSVGSNLFEVDGIEALLFDLVDAGERFTLADYLKFAVKTLNYVKTQNKLPVFVGGTGMYIDALVKGYKLVGAEDLKERSRLMNWSLVEVQNEVRRLNQDFWDELNLSERQNKQRLIRKIELLRSNVHSTKTKPQITPLLLYPKHTEPDFEKRVKAMLGEGWAAELKNITDLNKVFASGYKVVADLAAGKIDEARAVELISKEHRQYYKRQITWFEGKGRGYNLNRFNFQTDVPDIFKTIAKFLSDE